MLAIRMQRTGRKGHAMFRVVVQESRYTPTSGKIVAQLGSYDPHGKTLILDKEKASFYLTHGAQPSDRAARLLQADGVKLPDWVKLAANKERTVRNADKRRSTAPAAPVEETPAEEAAAAEAEAPAEEPAAEPTETAEAPVAEESTAEVATVDAPTEDTPAASEAPTEAPAAETEA